MKKEDIYMQLFGFSRPTYYKWKREGVLALKLIEENFTDEELVDYIENHGNNSDIQTLKKTIEDVLIDNAVFSAKAKLRELQKSIPDSIYNKGSIDILKDVINTIQPNDYDIKSSKIILLERVKGYEANWISLKNPNKENLLGIYVQKYFSKIECYAICKYSDEVFDY